MKGERSHRTLNRSCIQNTNILNTTTIFYEIVRTACVVVAGSASDAVVSVIRTAAQVVQSWKAQKHKKRKKK